VKKLIFLIFLLTSGTSLATTAYVTDDLEIMVRTGESARNKIIATLKSGTKINVIEANPATGYSKVALSRNREGYVLTRLLTKTPAAKDQLAAARARLKKLETNHSSVTSELAALKSDKAAVDSTAADFKTRAEQLQRELDQLQKTASNALRIQEERNQLQERMVSVERELETLKRENDVLKNNSAQDWFIVGAGVLLLGLLLGFILPKLSWQKKTSWNSSF